MQNSEAALLLLVELSTGLDAAALAGAYARTARPSADEARLEAVGTARPRRCEVELMVVSAEP